MQGYSLVELMVSLAMGLMILSALLTTYLSGSAAYRSNSQTSDLMNNGRYALNTLKKEVRQAGFIGFTSMPPDPRNTPLSTAITPVGNECLEPGASAGSFVSNIWQGVWGADDRNPFSGGKNCLPSYARGDVLVVRRLDANPVTTLKDHTLYFRSHYSKGEIFRGIPALACDTSEFPVANYPAPFNHYPCIAGTPGQDLQDFIVLVHVYYIRSYSVAASESPLVPALVRVLLQSDGTMTSELIANGIENMQIQYARTTTDTSNQYLDASGIAGTSYLMVGGSEWDDVNAVRIWLLARSSTADAGYTNSTSYPMGNVQVTAKDGYRRQVFSSVVSLRNHQK
jgi:type IV pilus assembly protein PilW